jgi:quercetin dioxygenase-like cupin family protein
MTSSTRSIMISSFLALTLAGIRPAEASDGGKAVVTPGSDLKWTAGSVPGVSTAVVQGDMATGASHFFLKYAAGFVTPAHHHTPDHYVALMSGALVLVVEGKEHRLAPGSYFALTGKAAHVARCEGSVDCVMFVDARGPWDVVPESGSQPKR